MQEKKLMKIKSGALSFYSKKAFMQMLLRFDMADPVDCVLLQKALDRTMVRYPYFRVKVVWKDGDIYLSDNDAPMVVEDSAEMRKLGSAETGYHLIEVHGHDHAIYLHFHHGIADGGGIFPMLRTLLYTYLCDYYQKEFVPSAAVNLPDSPIDPEEYAEPVPDHFYPPLDEPTVPRSENRYVLPEFKPKEKRSWYSTHIRFPMKEFVRFMKSVDASPAIMLSLFMCQAVERIHPEHEEDIVAELVWDYRDKIGLPKTHHNCVNQIHLTYNDRIKHLPLDRQGTCFRGMTIAQTGEADAINRANMWVGLCQKLETLDGFEQKSAAIDFVGDQPYKTFNISYAGQLDLGECEEKIQDMHAYSAGNFSPVIEIVSVGEAISIEIRTVDGNPVYIDALCDILNEQGIHYKRNETFEYSFPESVSSVAYDARDRDSMAD